MNWLVELLLHELVLTRWVGRKRYQYAVQHGLVGHGVSNGNGGPGFHIRGARCEFAGMQMMNLRWRPTIGVFGQPDLGCFIEVRSTVKPDGKMRIRSLPKPDVGPHMLVEQISERRYRGLGWLDASVARQAFPGEPEGNSVVHWVPQSELRPLGELREIAHAMEVS